MAIQLTDLTMGEIEEFENLAGVPFDEWADDGQKKGLPMRVLAYLIQRRGNANYTLEMTKTLTLTECQEMITGTSDPKE